MHQPTARARSLAYSLVAAPMLRLPSEALLNELAAPAFTQTLAVIDDAYGDPALTTALANLRTAAEAACTANDRGALLTELGRDRTYLLRALAPDVGAPPAYESHWQVPGSTESVMLDLTRAYRRAGVELSAEAHERPDYLGVELLFLGELAAQELTDEAPVTELRAEQKRFFATHVNPWATSYLCEALPLAQTDFFRSVLAVASALLAAEKTVLAAA